MGHKSRVAAISVDLPGLGVTLSWVMEINEDDPGGDDCIAESPGELAEILGRPQEIRRKGRVRRIA